MQIVNSTIPFYIIGKLKHIMASDYVKARLHLRPLQPPSFIINVSSMEGVFNRMYKSENHVHNNMAKAALNMLTRTCSSQFSQEGIYMYSVDTGWVTNENPCSAEKGKKAPLDCLDGAMRVLDPIYQGISKYASEPPMPLEGVGLFIKDYQVSRW